MSENDSVPTESDAEPTDTNVSVADDRSTPEQSDDTGDRKLSAEAARHRVAAREAQAQATAAETELIVAQARVEKLQRNQIDQHLKTKVTLPADFWLATDAAVADLLTDDGTEVDTDKVDAAVEAVLEGRDHWRAKLGPVGAPSSSVTGDGRYDVPTTEQPSWDTLLRGKTAG